MTFKLDQDTKLEKLNDSEWKINLADYTLPLPGAPENGGYLFAVLITAVSTLFPDKRPLSATTHIYNAAKPGEAKIKLVDVTKTNKYSSAIVHLIQANKVRLTLMATFANDDVQTLPKGVEQIPDVANPNEVIPKNEDCTLAQLPNETGLFSNVKLVVHKDSFLAGGPERFSDISGYISHADNRPIDYKSLAFFCDAFPPSLFNWLRQVGWVPTITLTCYFLRKPTTSGALKSHFKLEPLVGLYSVTNGYLWDENNNLVAVSRQIATFRPQKL